MTNLILGYCSNYKFTKISTFVVSALKHAKNTCLCLFAADMDEEFYSFAKEIGITVFDANQYRDESMHIMVNRFYMYREILERMGSRFDKILLTDVRDVFFQSDPLALDLPTDVIFSMENTRFILNETNANWVRDIYGDEVLKDIEQNYVSCAGTTIGNSSGIKKYVNIMIEQFERKKFPLKFNYVQGVHNYIAHYLKPSWSSLDMEDRFVSTLGCIGPEFIQIKQDVVLVKERFSPILHQWDRHQNLTDLFFETTRQSIGLPSNKRFEDLPIEVQNEFESLETEVTHARTSNSPIPIKIPVGPTLNELVSTGRAKIHVLSSGPFEVERVGVFFKNSFDITKSAYGNYFIDPAFRQMRSISINVFKSYKLDYLGGDSVIVVDQIALFDSTFDLASWRPESNIERLENGKYLQLKTRKLSTRHLGGDFFVGTNGAWQNYAHWMQQNLPRLVVFCQLRQTIHKLKVLLPSFLENSFQAQTLKLLDISEAEIETVDYGEIISLETVYLLNRIDLWSIPPICRTSANYLGRNITETASYAERIYIHRDVKTRNVSNFEDVRKILKEFDFFVLSFENMRVEDQIIIMRNAKYIIAEHGAGLVNILFCSPGARVLELFNPACVQPAFWSIATACSLGYGYLVGKHTPSEHRSKPDWNTDYTIPITEFRDGIIALLRQ